MPEDHSRDGWAWREAGSGGVPLLLLHGLGGSRISWDGQLDDLGQRRRVLAWDMPGYGAASPLDGAMTFASLADAVVDWADAAAIDRFHLAGISFGGMIAQYAAARHPQRLVSLSLLSTSPKFGLDGTQPDDWRAARLAPLDAGLEPVDVADRVLGALAGPSITPEAIANQRAAMARITGVALRRSIDCLVTHDSRSVLPHISTPTQCLVGALDDETPVAYSQAIVALVSGARLHVVEGAGHLLNVEAPDTVDALLAAHMLTTEGDAP